MNYEYIRLQREWYSIGDSPIFWNNEFHMRLDVLLKSAFRDINTFLFGSKIEMLSVFVGPLLMH